MKNYYKILEISRNASEKEIKKAYRLLAIKIHPDKNSQPDATLKFIEITEAYEVLSNNRRRQHYDQLLASEEQKTKINEQQKRRWENEVNQSSQRGKQRGTMYAKDFDYFSKKVISQTVMMLIIDIIIGMIFGEISSLLTISFIAIIIGIIITIVNFGETGLMVVGILMTIVGGLVFRKQVQQENLNSG